MARPKIPNSIIKRRTTITIFDKDMEIIKTAAWKSRISFSQFLTDSALKAAEKILKKS